MKDRMKILKNIKKISLTIIALTILTASKPTLCNAYQTTKIIIYVVLMFNVMTVVVNSFIDWFDRYSQYHYSQ